MGVDEALMKPIINEETMAPGIDPIVPNTITANDWVTTARIADDSITNALMGADAITGAEIADNAVNSEHYVDGSIDNAHLADDAVDSDEIAAGAIDLAHMSVNSIDSDQYVDGSIDTAHIADDQVTYAKIQNVSATDRILGRDSSGAGVIEEISPASLRTMINVEDAAESLSDGKRNQKMAAIWVLACGLRTIRYRETI